MKSKINVVIHKDGMANLLVLSAIGKHNGGENEIDQQTLTGFILGQKIPYPTTYKNTKVINEGDTLHISEDNGTTFTLSLTWCEVHELQPEQSPETNQAASEAPTVLLYEQTHWDDQPEYPELNK